MITARIVADSVSPLEYRLTSFVLEYPRFIHSELMTHRVFSRNAASSRAIPFAKMVRKIEENPAMPVKWGSSKPGMQSGDEVENIDKAVEIWEDAMNAAIYNADRLDRLGVHKSISNRLLEPYAHMTTLVTATDFENFFHLRRSEFAQPEFEELAHQMLELYLSNDPDFVETLDWHIPFGDQMDSGLPIITRLKIATARCARISYLNFENDIDVEKDIALHDRLAQSGHWSPFEHCAQAASGSFHSGNFRGWNQYRKTFPGENVYNIDLNQLRRPSIYAN